MIRRAPPLRLFALFLFVVGCGGGSSVATSDIVSSIPWTGSETLKYVLKDRDGREVGKAELAISREGLTTRLSQSFSDADSSDETSVVVDASTLKPISGTRTITTPTDKEELSVTYSSEGALIKQGDRQSGLSVPEHSYDNDMSLFLWRTLRFERGYSAAYVTIITNRRSRQTVELKVFGLESVTVPAGRFDAWKLDINAPGARQTAWFADTPSRPLLKYDNSRGTIFELQSGP